jgi:protein TonB
MSLLLGRALALSFMFHAYALAYLGTRLPQAAPARAAVADLSVWLREAPAAKPLPPPPPPPAEPAAPAAMPSPPSPPSPPRPAVTASLAKRDASAARTAPAKPKAATLPYPLEAVERGLEGDVMVRVFLDDAGNVIDSRLEASSGHALLDAAALRAARTLRALPDSSARETVIPVRFRLR